VRWVQRFPGNGVSTFSANDLADWAKRSGDDQHRGQFRRVRRHWRDLETLNGIERSTEADRAGDEYDGPESIAI
jgi:ferric-dicitrate binding protein FerR (iron transport regulator)